MEKYKKQEYLDNLLIELSCNKDYFENEDLQKTNIEKLKEIYADDFRHSYADLFFVLQDFFGSTGNDLEMRETLTQNLNILKEKLENECNSYPEDKNLQKVGECFKKYYDHVSLEVGRCNFLVNQIYGKNESNSSKTASGVDLTDNTHFKGIKDEIEKINQDLNSQRPTVTGAVKELSRIDEKIDRNTISSITTLTIFSAVILAFSGGITFQAGVFNGIGSGSTSAYRLVFVVALSGFVLFNTIFALLYIVSKLTKKNIATTCKHLSYDADSNTFMGDCKNCGDEICKRPFSNASSLCVLWHRYTYNIVVNSVLITMMYLTYFAYLGNKYENDYFLIIAIVLWVVLIPIVIVIKYAYYKLQYRRWIKKTENTLLKKYLRIWDKDKIPSFKEMYSSTIKLAVSKLYGTTDKTEEFNKFINNIEFGKKSKPKKLSNEIKIYRKSNWRRRKKI